MEKCGRNFVKVSQPLFCFSVAGIGMYVEHLPHCHVSSSLPCWYLRHGAGRMRKRKRGSGEMGVRAMELAQTLAETALRNAGSSGSRGWEHGWHVSWCFFSITSHASHSVFHHVPSYHCSVRGCVSPCTTRAAFSPAFFVPSSSPCHRLFKASCPIIPAFHDGFEWETHETWFLGWDFLPRNGCEGPSCVLKYCQTDSNRITRYFAYSYIHWSNLIDTMFGPHILWVVSWNHVPYRFW